MITAAALPLTDSQRRELQRVATSSSLAHRKVVQARALLWAAEGLGNEEIARRSTVDSDAIRRWRARFAEKGIDGVGVIAGGRGRKPSLPPGTVAEVVRITQHEKPADGSTHWTTRSLAHHLGIGKDAVAGIWSDHNLKPWRVDTFKISNDPHFEQKLVDVVGLYMNPPDRDVLPKRRLRPDSPAVRGGEHLHGVAAVEDQPGRSGDDLCGSRPDTELLALAGDRADAVLHAIDDVHRATGAITDAGDGGAPTRK